MKWTLCSNNQGSVQSLINIHFCLLLSANVMLPSNKPTGEADVSAAEMEIKMSVTHSCRVSEGRDTHRVSSAKVCVLCAVCGLK